MHGEYSMSTTLTNGLKLPDKGSVDWYADMQNNYAILDGAVGTVAEHTSALAGKAPLVHTHTKSDITDFPAYGTTAGTICEGNDSRLSDARTPVAHTHGKADITNLFNSANVWTNTNTFQQNITYERTNFFHQAVNPCYYLKDTGLEKGSIPPAAHTAYPGLWQDKNSTFLGYVRFVEYNSGWQRAEFRVSNLIKNGTLDPTGSEVNCTVFLELQPSGEKFLIPEQNNDINLGTSTNKWKSFNGINPGALSIFNPSATQDPIDVPNTWITDGSAWNTLNVSNMGDGWICLTYKSCGANDYILARFGGSKAAYPSMIFPAIMLSASKYFLYLLVPVAKAMGNIYLEIKLDSNAVLVKHSFMSAYGTV
jgi:hypothetical protein